MEIFWKVVVSLVCIADFIHSFKTKDLDGVENATIYRLAYAYAGVRVILFVAVNILHLWEMP
jgi:hypothetical protein